MSRPRWILLVFLALTVLAHAQEEPVKAPLLEDSFEGSLSKERWTTVRLHDTKRDRIATDKGNLVLALDTLGTDDKTVKLRGVRTKAAFTLRKGSAPLKIEATLGWNGQRNGSYLTLGVALVRSNSKVTPHKAKEALAFEYVGVPPAKNVRPYLWYRKAGGLRQLYTEGWPQAKREDRKGGAIPGCG